MTARTPSQLIDSTYILAEFKIVDATDNILMVVDAVGRKFVDELSCMLFFKFVIRMNIFSYTLRQKN